METKIKKTTTRKKTLKQIQKIFNQYKEEKLTNYARYDKQIIGKCARFINKIKQAINEKKTIAIYGDYDVDGIGATTQLYSMIKDFAIWANDLEIANRITYDIPSRQDGYGITEKKLNYLLSEYDYVFTVDNGTHRNFFDKIKDNKEITDRMFIVDHHPNGDFNDYDFVLNPNDGDFLISTGYLLDCLYRVLLLTNKEYAKENKVDKYADLTALTLISDMANLNDVKVRQLISLGINKIKQKERFFYKQLFKRAEPKVFYSDIAFKINPMINAIGRLSNKPAIGVKLLDFKDGEGKAYEIYNATVEINQKRKEILNEYSRDALESISKSSNKNKNLIFYYNKTIPMGINGLVAQKIFERTGIPAIAASDNPEQNNAITGSGRGVKMKEMLRSIHKGNEDAFQFGGHEAALGCKVADLDKFLKLNETLNEKDFGLQANEYHVPGTLLEGLYTVEDYKKISEVFSFTCDNIPFDDDFFISLKQAKVSIQKKYQNNFCSAVVQDIKNKESKFNVLLKTSDVEDQVKIGGPITLKLFSGHDFASSAQSYTSDIIVDRSTKNNPDPEQLISTSRKDINKVNQPEPMVEAMGI